jgi:hypothetical protein
MEIDTITVSHSQKLNNALYNGGQYEMTDHFVSVSASLEIGEDPNEVHKQLSTFCKEMVTKDLENTITSFQGGITAERFYTYIRDLVARRPIDGETYEECNVRQQAILQAIKRGIKMNQRDTLRVEPE